MAATPVAAYPSGEQHPFRDVEHARPRAFRLSLSPRGVVAPALDAPGLGKTAGGAGRPLIFGRGHNPIAFASVAQVAEVVDRALADPAYRGRVVEVVSEILSFDQ